MNPRTYSPQCADPGCLGLVVLLLPFLLGGCAQGCGPALPQIPDASMDAGLDDGGRTSFQTCEGAVVPITSGDGEHCGCSSRESCWGTRCTLQCAPCSETSPCPNGGSCQYLSPPACQGECVYSMDPCDGGVTDVSGSVELLTYGCQSDGFAVCGWRQQFDSTLHTVRCSVRLDSPSGAPRLIELGSWDAGRSVDWASAASGMLCRSGTEITPTCLWDANAEVRVALDAGGAAALFAYGTSDGLQPTLQFRALVGDVRAACRAAFKGWDGGRYPFID